jgi:hypothetical protein
MQGQTVTEEADPRAVGRIGVARPKGAKPYPTINDFAEMTAKHPLVIEAEQTTTVRGRPPKSPEASAFAIFSSCLKQIKTLDKTTQREVLALLNELLS